MNILMGNLFLVYIFSVFSRMNAPRSRWESDPRNYNKLFIILALVCLICVSGFRYKVGTDFYQYTENFIYTTKEGLAESDAPAFDYFVYWLKTYVSNNPQIMFLSMAIITNILIVINLWKYSPRFELSMWLYITTFVYYSTMNGVRQWVASSIIFCATKYLQDREFKKYLIPILFASMVHASALVMIPLYFLVNVKSFSKTNLYIITGFMAAVFAYGKFIPILFKFLEGTQYAHYFDIVSDTSNGIHPLRLIVYFIPIAMFAIFYKQLNPNKDMKVDRLFNLCIIGFLLMFLATKQVFFARLVYYFDLYYLLLIPRLVDIGNIKLNRLMYFCIMCGYFAFSYVLLASGEAWIVPYTFKITLF